MKSKNNHSKANTGKGLESLKEQALTVDSIQGGTGKISLENIKRRSQKMTSPVDTSTYRTELPGMV